MAVKDRLSTYRGKRDTARSGEPAGKERRTRSGEARFVIQRHNASSLHFDFRLEIDGVLVSWAVPKGPSTDPRAKRLATRTEDHPLDYADFEGRIAEGYGAGTVIVWDTGTYRNLSHRGEKPIPIRDALDDGHLTFWLDGRKLTGGYALTRAKLRGGQESWLLVKLDDEGADRRRKPATSQPESVLSGRTNESLDS